jgi:peptidoglycan/LPS O-acetylase OafA/YrhL
VPARACRGCSRLPTGAPGAGSAGYRPDIDGLRAVAVLAVVLFHAFTDPHLRPSFVRDRAAFVDVTLGGQHR